MIRDGALNPHGARIGPESPARRDPIPIDIVSTNPDIAKFERFARFVRKFNKFRIIDKGLSRVLQSIMLQGTDIGIFTRAFKKRE
jgi:hypothetical protein